MTHRPQPTRTIASPWKRLHLLIATAMFVLAGSPAYAAGGHVDGTVTGISPAFNGVQVFGTAGGDITVLNTGTQALIVFGYFDEPYVKIDASGVWVNQNSPSNALNSSFTISTIPSNPSAANQPPNWVKQNTPQLQARSYRWHDHRAHYMGANLPPVAAADPSHIHVVEHWTIPITYGGTKGAINGTLTYYPSSHVWSYVTYTVIGLVVVGAVVVVVVDRRRLKAKAAAASSGT